MSNTRRASTSCRNCHTACGTQATRPATATDLHTLDCEAPIVLLRGCGDVQTVRCGTTRESRCLPCSQRNRRHHARIIADGLNHHGTLGGRLVYFVTLTAPGSDPTHRQFVPKQHYRKGQTRPPCDCAADVELWNPTASSCWNTLRTNLRRDLPGLEFHRVTEIQEGHRRKDGAGRGALHHHVLIVSDGPLDVLRLQALALRAGYGCVIDVEPVASHRQMVNYLTKYVVKAVDARHRTPWALVDPATGEVTPRRANYRCWSQSRGFSYTKSSLLAILRDTAIRQAEHKRSLYADPDHQPADLQPVAAATGPPT